MEKAIIFDLDGTLFNISADWYDTYNRFIHRYQFHTNPEELYDCIGSFEKNTQNILVDKKTICDYVNDKIHIQLTTESFEDLLESYRSIPLEDTDTLYAVLKYLSQKYELYAYTNWYTKNQTDRLKNYDLDQFFTTIYGWDILPSKPSETALKRIAGNRKMEDCIMIGDNIDLDLALPKKMGMETIFLNQKGIQQTEHKEIHNVKELIKLL